jgi:hypothetical protein
LAFAGYILINAPFIYLLSAGEEKVILMKQVGALIVILAVI